MLHLVGDIVKYFSFDEINIDNWIFKLYYKGTFILLLIGSMVGIVTQYFGEPINCDFKGIDSEMASDYCWIHGSSYIPPEYQQHMKCIVDLDGVESADDAPDTSYYQWVTFILLVQAGTFYLPYKMWVAMEGGLLEEFGLDAKSRIMLREEYGDALVMESVVEKYVKYFRSILHRNNYYFGKYLLCEALNVVILFLNFYVTDLFLNGNFWYYGWDVIQFGRMSRAEQKNSVNPFCRAFPLEVSCTVPNIGAGGGEQNHNGLCVLSQNVINEKMYLAIWFWMVFLIILAPFCIVYRLLTILFDGFRTALLMSRIGNTNDKIARKAIRVVMTRCYMGDWFLLYQISKNVNMYFFRAFMKELRLALQSNGAKKQPYIEKNKLDNHLPSGGGALLQDESSDEDTDDDIKKESPLSLDLEAEGKSSAPTLHRARYSVRSASASVALTGSAPLSNSQQRKYLQNAKSYRLTRMLPGKGHHGRKVGNKKRSMSGVDDFEISMMFGIK